ncbi:VanZ family protein [Kitasatospora sp. CB01950]|uniref:VanZ family protein n=1 Tax=Kitasatospora sp. CB01950 TaxID=1703930 RepID=UPI000938C887|nr:VanZ family protein [Kitasatospora sp. CB01950]
MIRAILNGNPGLLPAFLVTALLLGALSFFLGKARGLPRRSALLGGVSLAGVLAATLYPTGGARSASRMCLYSRDFATAFSTQQGLMNVALFVPLAFFAAHATRRPALVLAGCVGWSAVTETVQSLTPGIGRACDSGDFVANSAGALLGVALASALRRAWPGRREWSLGAVALVVLLVPVAVVQRAAVTPTWSDAALSPAHDPDQLELARRNAELLYGPGTAVANVQHSAAMGETPEQLLVTTATGSFRLEWPSGRLVYGSLIPFAPPTGGSDEEARAAADAFAATWFPGVTSGADVDVYRANPATARRTVQYRRFRADGLLLPVRLDIDVDPDGRVAQVNSRIVDDPDLPAVTVTEEAAIAAVTSRHSGPVKGAFLLALKTDGSWRACWAVTLLADPDPARPGVSYVVDALTGEEIVANASR